MRRNTIHRIWLAWMLLMTLMPLSVVKVFHNHCDETSATYINTQPGKTHHACDSCPTCQFMLSPFIETSPAPLTYIPFYIRWKTGTFQDKKLAIAFYPHYLRGPPSNFRHIV